MQRRRIIRLAVVLVALFLVLAGRLTWLQGVQWRHYHLQAEQRRTSIRFTPAPRGRIIDREGRVLAQDAPVHELVYTLRGVQPAPLIVKRVARILRGSNRQPGIPYTADDLRASLREHQLGFRRHLDEGGQAERYIWLSGLPAGPSRSLKAAIRRRPGHYAGIEVEVDGDRGEVWVDPRELFAGELAIRSVARRLEVDPHPWLEQLDREYDEAREIENATEREYAFGHEERRLVAEVPFDLVIELTYHPDRYPGLHVREARRRSYPAGEVLAQLVGYIGAPSPQVFQTWKEQDRILDHHRTIDDIRTFQLLREDSRLSAERVGLAGLEYLFDDRLRGYAGARIVEIDGRGREHGDPVARELATPGIDVELSLDLELCQELRRIFTDLEYLAGSALIADPNTGELLGWYSHPSYHPSRLREDWNRLSEMAKLGPFYDRPNRWPLAPGSIVKVAYALGALQDGVITPEHTQLCERFYDQSRFPNSFRCNNHLHGEEIDVRQAISKSCNVFFYHLGVSGLETQGMVGWGEQLGLWQPTGLELREKLGIRPRDYPLSTAIGQGFTVTPLQALRMTCGIATRGTLPELHLLPGSPPRSRPIPAERKHFDVVIEGMVAATETGTASEPEIGLRPFDCAVKTGTAEVIKNEENTAWMIGFAPVESPVIAFLVEVEKVPDQSHGGDVAGPVVARTLEWLQEHRGLDLGRR